MRGCSVGPVLAPNRGLRDEEAPPASIDGRSLADGSRLSPGAVRTHLPYRSKLAIRKVGVSRLAQDSRHTWQDESQGLLR